MAAAATPKLIHRHILLLLLVLICKQMIPAAVAGGGNWKLLQSNIGVSAMHMQLLNNDRVVIFDRTDFGYSNISLPNHRCRDNPDERAVKHDCTAHSVEYDVASNSIRPLFIYSNPWCSSGSAMADGSLMQTGGWYKGEIVTRSITACRDHSCDWKEFTNSLNVRRWYATNHILPDNRQFIVGGNRAFSYEFYPKHAGADQAYDLPFLRQTNDRNQENNLYPFVFLNVDGNLFIFANNRAILFDYVKGKLLRTYPAIPGGDPRNYPSTGSAALLPLYLSGKYVNAEVLVCGGAPTGSYLKVKKSKIFVEALNTCGRIRINDPNPQWEMETMPMGRVMSDMVMLPNGNVLIINGASKGAAGWEYGREPTLTPLIYRPNNAVGSRFEQQNPSTIPRMYHSTAVLLRDGRVLVGGSNPNEFYNFTGVLFPTDLTLEAYSPGYMSASMRPWIVSPASQSKVGYGQKLGIKFIAQGKINSKLVSVTMVRPPFNTHSFSMNQRVLVLSSTVKYLGGTRYGVGAMMPASKIIAPPGYYLLFVVYQDVPSEGIWIRIN